MGEVEKAVGSTETKGNAIVLKVTITQGRSVRQHDQENEPGNFFRGGYIERELVYEGKDLKEIAAQIERDENAHGEKCFVFQGFMFAKGAITAAQMKEPEY